MGSRNNRYSNPGPGDHKYNIAQWLLKRPWAPIPVLCFIPFEGYICFLCGKTLFGDFYQARFNEFYCEVCHRKSEIGNFRRKKVLKLRHCSFFHGHIGVRGITTHKTLDHKLLRSLERKERSMWVKFGTETYIPF